MSKAAMHPATLAQRARAIELLFKACDSMALDEQQAKESA